MSHKSCWSKFFTVIILTFLSIASFGQKKQYLGSDNTEVPQAEAFYVVTYQQGDGGAVSFEKIRLSTDEVVEKGRYLSKDLKVKDGYFVEEIPLGSARGSYVNDKRTGLWEYYNGRGNLSEEKTYDYGVELGKWKKYHANGKPKSEGEFGADNLKVGLWKNYHRHGGMISEADYKDGNVDVQMLEYTRHGELKGKGMVNQVGRTGAWEFYGESGNLEWTGAFENDLKTGLWRCRDANGWFLEGTFKAGQVVEKFRCLDHVPNPKGTPEEDKYLNIDGAYYLIEENYVIVDGLKYLIEDGGVVIDGKYYQIEEEEEEEIIEESIYKIVEDMPEYIGGELELFKYLGKNIVYPALAKDVGISGRVYVTFLVTKCGLIEDVKVLRGIGGGCDEEAVRVVENMPAWNPGKQRGKRVRVQYNLPIFFNLK